MNYGANSGWHDATCTVRKTAE
uniref:Uncharacterized protein n=1 Tax=Anopheles minimus TaxID=112268 RepID=A0A182WNJ7_9DIPT